MFPLDPRVVIFIGFILVLLGAVLPMLIVIQVLESTFFLNFFAATASTLGLFMGVTGVAYYVKLNRE